MPPDVPEASSSSDESSASTPVVPQATDEQPAPTSTSPTTSPDGQVTAGADADADADVASTADHDSDVPGLDPLVARTAKRIADAINDFKRDLDQRDSVWGTANGSFELALNTDGTSVYQLTIVHDPDGEEYPVSVRAELKTQPNGAPAPLPRPKPTRRASDAALEKDIVSRRKRKLDDDDDDDNDDHAAKRARTIDVDDDEIMEGNMMPNLPPVSKEELDDLFVKFREDVQDDTTECVNHVQRLLRRFKEEWHERKKWEDEQATRLAQRASSRQHPGDSSGNGNDVAFPSSSLDRDDQGASTADVVRRESKLLASQIRWVEECRRVAANVYDKREETWRTTSASFHERNRQDREAFQNRMLHESGMQGKVLNQILNEVKRIGLYQQSMKWETPDPYGAHSHSHSSTPGYPPPPMVPQFPTQAAQAGPITPGQAAGRQAGRGSGRGSNKKQ